MPYIQLAIGRPNNYILCRIHDVLYFHLFFIVLDWVFQRPGSCGVPMGFCRYHRETSFFEVGKTTGVTWLQLSNCFERGRQWFLQFLVGGDKPPKLFLCTVIYSCQEAKSGVT